MYAGDAECVEVFKSLSGGGKTALIDVRTTREWESIGVPDLSELGKETIFVEWQVFPTMAVNPAFADQVDAALKKQEISKDDAIYFLCRSGARSQSAAIALTQKGYKKAYNIIGGFEGNPNENGERGKINGWIFEGLPHKTHVMKNKT